MERMWLMDEERLQFGLAGARYALEHLNWDAIAHVFESAYATLLQDRARA
jgi:hypothetical protein